MAEIVIVISDLHLGQGDGFDIFTGPGKSKEFCEFMKHASAREGDVELVINGDFVDFLQLKPWRAEVNRAEAKTKIVRIVSAHKDSVFRALGEFLAISKHKITVLLGNHDVELAFPEVWSQLAGAILDVAGVAAGPRLRAQAIESSRVTYVRQVGGVPIHIEHGNLDDGYNSMNYVTLFHDAERNSADFQFPPGTRLVYDIMNRHKDEFRFVDLLKPEVPAVPLLLLALKPGAVVDVPGIGLKSLAALGNGFIGWLRTKIAGPTLGRVDQNVPAGVDEDQLSKDMAIAYQESTSAGKVVSETDAVLLQQYLESSGASAAPAQPVMGPKLSAARKRLARAAIDSLGHRVDLSDTTYYYIDQFDLPDVKSAKQRLVGDIKIVTFGHTHRPLKTEFPGLGLYLNSGAWANQITLPGKDEDVSEWLEKVRTNDDSNRHAFPTYITFGEENGGVTASLNLWDGTERSLWRTHITA